MIAPDAKYFPDKSRSGVNTSDVFNFVKNIRSYKLQMPKRHKSGDLRQWGFWYQYIVQNSA